MLSRFPPEDRRGGRQPFHEAYNQTRVSRERRESSAPDGSEGEDSCALS